MLRNNSAAIAFGLCLVAFGAMVFLMWLGNTTGSALAYTLSVGFFVAGTRSWYRAAKESVLPPARAHRGVDVGPAGDRVARADRIPTAEVPVRVRFRTRARRAPSAA